MNRPCGCGVGDSGCSECGCCRTCAKEAGDIEQHEQDMAAAAAAVAWGGPGVADGLLDARNRDDFKWSLVLGEFFPFSSLSYFVLLRPTHTLCGEQALADTGLCKGVVRLCYC